MYHLNVPHTLSLNTLVKSVLGPWLPCLVGELSRKKEKKKNKKLIKEGTFYMFHITFVFKLEYDVWKNFKSLRHLLIF